MQSKDELNKFYESPDPWGYSNNVEDKKRKDILLSIIPNSPKFTYLDIGCGNGFITQSLKGNKVIGVDISDKAINHAKTLIKNTDSQKRIDYVQGSIFSLNELFPNEKFDIILITGVLYPQYIGNAKQEVIKQIKSIIQEGYIISVHIDEWYQSFFPFTRIDTQIYPYKTYHHKLEVFKI